MANEATLKREVTLVRTINAPRELVFRAFTDRDLLAAWWGPTRYTNPVCEINPVPGGQIKIDMRGPDGMVYPMAGILMNWWSLKNWSLHRRRLWMRMECRRWKPATQ